MNVSASRDEVNKKLSHTIVILCERGQLRPSSLLIVPVMYIKHQEKRPAMHT